MRAKYNKNTTFLIFSDILSVIISLYFAFSLRFDFLIPELFLNNFYNWLPVFTVIHVCIFYVSGMYGRIWRYTSLFDLYAILLF